MRDCPGHLLGAHKFTKGACVDCGYEPGPWVVKSSDGLYWDLGLFRQDLWVEGQTNACKFSRRGRAVMIAARTKGRVVRLVPKRSNA